MHEWRTVEKFGKATELSITHNFELSREEYTEFCYFFHIIRTTIKRRLGLRDWAQVETQVASGWPELNVAPLCKSRRHVGTVIVLPRSVRLQK